MEVWQITQQCVEIVAVEMAVQGVTGSLKRLLRVQVGSVSSNPLAMMPVA